jgi:AcrR family transcriptional regulator
MAVNTRDALVEAAAQLLDDGGVAAVTLREVGHRAGVSHNAPYRHFADKEALLAAVAARELTNRNVVATAATRRRRPPAALRAFLTDFVGWALAHPARFRLVFGAWTTADADLATAAAAAREALVELVRTNQQTGHLPAGDPERLAALVQAVSHGAVELALPGHLARDGKGKAGPADLVDDLLTYLAAAVG